MKYILLIAVTDAGSGVYSQENRIFGKSRRPTLICQAAENVDFGPPHLKQSVPRISIVRVPQVVEQRVHVYPWLAGPLDLFSPGCYRRVFSLTLIGIVRYRLKASQRDLKVISRPTCPVPSTQPNPEATGDLTRHRWADTDAASENRVNRRSVTVDETKGRYAKLSRDLGGCQVGTPVNVPQPRRVRFKHPP